MEHTWNEQPPSHFKRMWRQKFTKGILKLNKGNLRIATQILTGHATLNYHLHKYKPNKYPKTCPHCLVEEETVNHFLGQCPKWSHQRGTFFNSFYLSSSDIVDSFSLTTILNFINDTKRLAIINTTRPSQP